MPGYGRLTDTGSRGPNYGPQGPRGVAGRRVAAGAPEEERRIAPRESFMVVDTSVDDVTVFMPDIGCVLEGNSVTVVNSGGNSVFVTPLAGQTINEAEAADEITGDQDSARYTRYSAGGVRSYYRG